MRLIYWHDRVSNVGVKNVIHLLTLVHNGMFAHSQHWIIFLLAYNTERIQFSLLPRFVLLINLYRLADTARRWIIMRSVWEGLEMMSRRNLPFCRIWACQFVFTVMPLCCHYSFPPISATERTTLMGNSVRQKYRFSAPPSRCSRQETTFNL